MDIGDIFRKATRPIVTIVFAAVIADVVVNKIPIPWEQWALLGSVILWWFGDRTRQHIKEKAFSPSKGENRDKGERP